MKDSGTYLVPTITPSRRMLSLEDKSKLPYYIRDKVELIGDVPFENFRKCLKAGLKMAAGTDAGTNFNPHGELLFEMKVMESLGMPLMKVIKAATGNAAEALGVENQVGTLEAGKMADIILVKGNLSKDLNVLKDLSHVIINGRSFNFKKPLPTL